MPGSISKSSDEAASLRETMAIIAMVDGGCAERISKVASLSPAELLAACNWQRGEFRVHDEPGEHDPCHVVLPDGAMLSLNHWNDELTDVARAVFIARACNSALSHEPRPACAPDLAQQLSELADGRAALARAGWKSEQRP